MPTLNTADSLPLLVNNQHDLDAVCGALAECTQVAVDTEFVRTNTYAPHLGLLQLTAGELTVCIDPLADLDLSGIWRLLFDPGRTSVMHSAKQDMEVMWFDQGAIVQNLLDTQVCAALLGYPAQIGYAGLCKELLGIELAKSQTRTDWSRRPLTEAQLQYAAEDVLHLPEMLAALESELRKRDRWEWALEDSAALCDISLYRPEPATAWRRLKSIPFLPPAQQARARGLAAWRESRAVNSDKPRGWILSDKALLQLATENPQNRSQLDRIEDLPPAVIRKQGGKLLDILQTTDSDFRDGKVIVEQQKVNIDREKALSKKMGQIVRQAAERLGIAAEVLASKRDINALIRGEENARVASGWRRTEVGEQLAAIAAE